MGLAFRAGMFNIGGRGQMLLAGAASGWVAYQFDLPGVVHLPFAILLGMLAGALWAGIAGVLKARTGAHEVIVTIMLNYVAYYLVFFALSQQSLLQAPGSFNPKSLPAKESATMPKLFGDQFNLHLGFLLALVAVAFTWWLLERSALGFRIRAVGINPPAAKASGINVGRTYTVVMLIAGALVGLAGANQVLGTVTSGVTVDLDAGIGFDAITVALLGRSRPLGILAAGLLWPHVPMVVSLGLLGAAAVLPYVAVLLANAGRERRDEPDVFFEAREIGAAPRHDELGGGR